MDGSVLSVIVSICSWEQPVFGMYYIIYFCFLCVQIYVVLGMLSLKCSPLQNVLLLNNESWTNKTFHDPIIVYPMSWKEVRNFFKKDL